MDRERKVDLKSFSKEDSDRILNEVGAKVASLINQTKDEINTLLKIYGYEASFQVNFHDLNKQTRKGRPKKAL